MTAQASNTGPLICRLILMPNDPLGQINSNNPHPCLSSLLARRSERGIVCAHTAAGAGRGPGTPKGPGAGAALSMAPLAPGWAGGAQSTVQTGRACGHSKGRHRYRQRDNEGEQSQVWAAGLCESWRLAWHWGGRAVRDTGHALGSRAHRQGVCPAGTGLHFSPAPSLAFALSSPQLTPCLLVHCTMINQHYQHRGFIQLPWSHFHLLLPAPRLERFRDFLFIYQSSEYGYPISRSF